ncbi:Hsp70 family protein [Streptacidiphilus sp. EB129]|uniref:Hsp70 family protein n=1 Tax=Streptacidiphilus sp. EB129 TaxID=3156262 RepID=UPI0035146CDC
MIRTLGIDLGTTNSVVAQLRRGEPEIVYNKQNQEATPSVVGRGRRGELLVGTAARGRMASDSENVIRSAKRFMGRKFRDQQVQAALGELDYKVTAGQDGDVNVWLGGRSYTPIEISAIILRKLKEDAEERAGAPFQRAVITVPAYFGERQVAATQEAGRLAGFHVLRIINEPTAAALAYGMTGDLGEDGRTVLVYDLGGGTFDISILLLIPGSCSVLGIEGDNLLGGDDFDKAITNALLEDARAEFGSEYQPNRKDRPRIATVAEPTKIDLSSQLATDLTVVGLGDGQLILETEFDRTRFEQLIEAQVERTIELTHKAIMEAHLTVADIDEVLLVGGSTSIPLVIRRLGEVFGPKRIKLGGNPMQCVALGAAVQSALLGEVECPECRQAADLAEESCGNCSASLVGAERVSCPTCYIPVPAEDATCPKCDTALDGSGAAPGTPEAGSAKAAPRPAAQPQNRSCPRCGTPAAPGETECDLCGSPLGGAQAADQIITDEPAGLRCAQCRTVNVPGAETCSGCGAWLQVANPFDITPKSLGIELNDGRFAVIMPKGTSYPTSDPVSRDFHVSGKGRQRLEVAVLEGDKEIAQQNELIGHLNLRLPENFSGRVPVTVSFGLSQDRTITLSVRIHGGPQHTVKMVRASLDPQTKGELDKKRTEIESYTEHWSDELTEAEKTAARKAIEDLDDFSSGMTEGRSVEAALRSFSEQADIQRRARGTDAYVGAVLFFCEKLIRDEDREALRRVHDELRAARERADFDAMKRLTIACDRLADSLGPNILVVTYSHIYVSQNLLSPALTQRLRSALRAIDDGLESANMEQVNQALSTLVDLYAAAQAELKDRPVIDTTPVRLE